MDSTTYIISLEDEFIWQEYKEQVDEIMKSQIPLTVIWDLSKLTYVPWKYEWKQIYLMLHYRPIIQQHIKNNIIILPNKEWKKTLEFIFTIVPPVSPTKLHYE